MEIVGRSVFTGAALRLEAAEETLTAALPVSDRADMPWIAPGFVDLQVNGYRGLDYSAPDLDPADVGRLVELLAVSGTTRHVPTVITSAQETIVRNLERIAAATAADPWVAHAIAGIHVEGPFIAPEDGPRGAHDPNYVRDPDVGELEEWIAAAGGLLRIVTLAPERPGALRFIERAVAEGIRISIGHTAATPEQVRDAVAAGATLSTHLGNGSHAVIPRLRNYVWEQLAADGLSAGVIADGFHVPDAVLKCFLRTKGGERLFLVSDVAPLGGKAPGRYKWGNMDVEVHPDGHVGLADTPYLAGAGHLIDRGIGVLLRATGCTLADATRSCTAVPSAVLGDPGYGKLEAGAPADLVLFSMKEGRVEVSRTWIAGRPVFDAGRQSGPGHREKRG